MWVMKKRLSDVRVKNFNQEHNIWYWCKICTYDISKISTETKKSQQNTWLENFKITEKKWQSGSILIKWN